MTTGPSSTPPPAASAPAPPPAHYAFFYDNPASYTSGITAFLRDGMAAGEPTLIAVPRPSLLLLQHLLDAGESVAILDMTSLGANPARIIPALREFTATHPGRRTRFVGEPIWPSRTPAELAEVTRHEALLNLAFAGAPVTICCPYNITTLPPDILADAARTHPHLRERGTLNPSPGYAGPTLAAAITGQPPAPAPGTAETLTFGHGELPAIRRHVRRRALRAGLDADRTHDLVIAVNELITNTLRHGGGPGACRTWQDENTLICEISGPGHITDPLVGTHPPATRPAGYGLWLITQLCDLTELRTGPWGTTIRLHMHTRPLRPVPPIGQ